MVSTEVLQYIFAAVIWATTLIGSILPLFVTAPRWISRCESLAGGVFLGAGLAHLLDDSIEKIEEYGETTGKEMKYPIAPAVALTTYVLLTFVELFSYSEHDAMHADHENEHDHHHDHVPLNTKDSGNYESIDDGTKKKIVEFGTNLKQITCTMISLYIIMDIHSAIEGLALGIITKQSSVIAIFCAVIGHKPVEAFALGLIILKDRPTKLLFWAMTLLYTLMSPIATVVGVNLQKESNALAQGIIAAFSAGTFLFVGVHEMSEMFEHKHSMTVPDKFWHFGFFAVGVLWMLLIAIVEIYGEED